MVRSNVDNWISKVFLTQKLLLNHSWHRFNHNFLFIFFKNVAFTPTKKKVKKNFLHVQNYIHYCFLFSQFYNFCISETLAQNSENKKSNK